MAAAAMVAGDMAAAAMVAVRLRFQAGHAAAAATIEAPPSGRRPQGLWQ